ncbi:DMT family transporter [Azohydromonas caseinilytica]|uniref:DMT family transporter n=1 Tax=Azohydromonas caseinilytica TaxID=2728836 RepID=A0A848FI08_9BURK|nr:DMT family transporter [Azohydromonas caseinilytica]NML18892.1 DMT family transporter [Azohydromonas caseinilytica]
MSSRKPLDTQAVGLMLLLCTIWALQQIAVKAAAPDMAPVLQISLRSGLSALLVGALMRRRGERLVWRDGAWRAGALVGLLFGLEFLLVGEGLRHTSASHLVVFLYTAPIFAALGLHWKLRAERLRPLQWAGIALAFGGIALAFLGRSPSQADTDAMLLGDLLGLLGGAAWGATTVAVRCSRLATAPATETLLYQLIGACVLLLPAVLLSGQTTFTPTPRLLGSLAFQVLVVSFASFLAWFWLLRQYLASRLGVFSFLTPLFGVGFGVALLGEPLEPAFLQGAGLVLAGIALVGGQGVLASLAAALGRRRAAGVGENP